MIDGVVWGVQYWGLRKKIKLECVHFEKTKRNGDGARGFIDLVY